MRNSSALTNSITTAVTGLWTCIGYNLKGYFLKQPDAQITRTVAMLTPLPQDQVGDKSLVRQGFACNSSTLAINIAAAVKTLWEQVGQNHKEGFPLPAIIGGPGPSGQGQDGDADIGSATTFLCLSALPEACTTSSTSRYRRFATSSL